MDGQETASTPIPASGISPQRDGWIQHLLTHALDRTVGETVLELDPTLAAGGFGFPDLVSGDRGVIVTAFPEGRPQLVEYGVHVIDLESGRSTGTVAGVAGAYAESGHLVSVTADGTITAQRLWGGGCRGSPFKRSGR